MHKEACPRVSSADIQRLLHSQQDKVEEMRRDLAEEEAEMERLQRKFDNVHSSRSTN